MTRYYVDKTQANEFIDQITRQQIKNKLFVNVAVKPYRGKKYDKENTVVIIVG